MNPGSAEVARRPLTARLAVSGLAVLAAITAILLSPSEADAQQNISEISGRVINGTAGSAIPSDLEVVLLVIDETQAQIVERQQQTVDATGVFRFTEILQAPNYFYRVVADNGDHTPYIDVVTGDASTDLEITIWDSTASLENMVVESYALLVPAQSLSGRTRQIGFLAIVTLRNDGDRVWIPDVAATPAGQMPELLRFSLPEGYEGLSPENTLQTPSEILEVPNGFAIVGAIPPGSHDFIFTYAADYDGDEFGFPINLFYGAEKLRVMIPDVGAEITGEGLGAAEIATFDDAAYRVVEGNDYARGSQLNLLLSSLPEPTLLQSSIDFFQGKTYILVIVWVAGAAMLAVLIYSLVSSKRRMAQESAGAGGDPGAVSRSREEVVGEIAELDDRHAAGDIDDEEYNRRRDALKREALGQAAKPPGEE